MHDYFKDKHIIIDEMHGAGRAYLSKVLGEIGIPHSVIHAERDPELPGLDYANPEEPFINSLKSAVKETGADLGVGLDTDADRFGIVDRGGNYFRPNQILPMLVKYLGVDRELTGRVIATQTGSPLIEPLAALIKDNEENKPAKGVLPSYVGHPFYKLIAGDINTRILEHAFMVPVGIKYIEEIRRTDANYKALKELPDGWRDVILIGGEESSGLTSRGHVTDKDGIWADLLVLDMLAYYGTRTVNPLNAISEIWDETVNMPGCWHSYGGAESGGSHSGRVDVDAILEAKEAFIDHYLEMSPSEGV
jgi:phosphomannomutase